MKNESIKENGHSIAVIDGKQIELKYCTSCKTWHPVEEFYYHVHVKKDHLDYWCKSCRKKRIMVRKNEALLQRYNECKSEIEKIEEQLKLL